MEGLRDGHADAIDLCKLLRLRSAQLVHGSIAGGKRPSRNRAYMTYGQRDQDSPKVATLDLLQVVQQVLAGRIDLDVALLLGALVFGVLLCGIDI